MSSERKSENPYARLSLTFNPHKYYGSREWARELLAQVSAVPSPISSLILGLPGMGKSTLLRYLATPEGARLQIPDSLSGPFREHPQNLFFVYIEYRLLPTGMHPFVYLYRQFCAAYSSFRQQSERKTLEIPDVSDVLEADKAAELLGQAIHHLAENNIRCVLLLDDFDLAFATLSFEYTTRLRPWRRQVAFVLATERRLELVNPEAAGSPFFQAVMPRRMGGLTMEEARRLVTDPLLDENVVFPSSDIDFLLEQADTHPVLLIQGCSALWRIREENDLLFQAEITLPERLKPVLLGRLQEEFQLTFRLYWDRLESQDRSGLVELALEKKQAQEMMQLGPLTEARLVKFDHASELYVLFSPLFRDFILSVSGMTAPTLKPTLTGLEESLYSFLKERPDKLCSFNEIWTNVWKISSADVDDEEARAELLRRTQVMISRLRKKLGPNEDIRSIRDQGYVFVVSL